MRLKLKKTGCYLIIILLLPYVVTVFLNGPSITSYSMWIRPACRLRPGRR